MVIVDLDGQVVDGSLRPSSDTKTHAVLYREFSGIRGVAHTHSTHAIAWAQALRDIPLYGTTHADFLPVAVPCTPVLSDDRIVGDYEWETGLQIVELLRDRGYSPTEVPMALVGGHGPFTWGPTASSAVFHSVILEEVARVALLTEAANPAVRPLPAGLIQKHYDRKHGDDAYYGQ
jgi:L-ribulose-5-phosphate 4-epimerase